MQTPTLTPDVAEAARAYVLARKPNYHHRMTLDVTQSRVALDLSIVPGPGPGYTWDVRATFLAWKKPLPLAQLATPGRAALVKACARMLGDVGERDGQRNSETTNALVLTRPMTQDQVDAYILTLKAIRDRDKR